MANLQSLLTFNNAKVTYELVLKHSGYKREMKILSTIIYKEKQE